MDRKEIEERIIEQYRQDENTMILVFAQWCINHDLNPAELYRKAYPAQGENPELVKTLELTVPKEESETVPDETLLNVLQLFGNDDLAFVVTEEMEKRERKK